VTWYNAEHTYVVLIYIMHTHRLIYTLNVRFIQISVFVTGFAKRVLPDTSNLPTLMIDNFRLVNATDLKYGKQEAPT